MEVKVVKLMGTRDLTLRSWADELFNYLAEIEDRVLILDFLDIEFVSRSFAHEYLKKKQSFGASIFEKNLNENVKKMFELVSRASKKKNTNIIRPAPAQNL